VLETICIILSGVSQTSCQPHNGATMFVSWEESPKGFALELNPQQLLRIQLTRMYGLGPPIRDVGVG
jgi:hypothetical protein